MRQYFALAILAATAAAEGHIVQIPDGYALTAAVAAGNIQFNVTVKQGSWFGMGFGTTGMTAGSDMIMCSVPTNAAPTCTDMVSQGETAPKADDAPSQL